MIDALRNARDKCAAIIEQYGDEFLPVFERLESEINEMETGETAKEKASRIARKNGIHFGLQTGHHLPFHTP